MEFFTAKKIKKLRKRAKKVSAVPRGCPQGWSKSSNDPMKLLSVFSSLSIKEGFVLRAYQFREGGNGKGFVWAMPIESPFPEPKNPCKGSFWSVEVFRPPSAQESVMEVIEGDGSNKSYLHASLFSREVSEIGAMWHGFDWSTYTILDESPLINPRGVQTDFGTHAPFDDKTLWKWVGKEPDEWRPSVSTDAESAIVTFYSYSGLGQHAIYRHVDTYPTGSYCFDTEKVVISRGPAGYRF